MGSPRPPKPPGHWFAERREREASSRLPSCQPQEVTELDKEELVPKVIKSDKGCVYVCGGRWGAGGDANDTAGGNGWKVLVF